MSWVLDPRRTLALAAGLLLAACSQSPKLTASWYISYCSGPQASGTRDAATSRSPCKGDQADENVDDIYVAVVNLGEAGDLASVALLHDPSSNGGQPDYLFFPARATRLGKGRILILPMGAFPVEGVNPRRCLVPTALLVRWNNHPARTIKVRGQLPTALPREWIDRCSGTATG